MAPSSRFGCANSVTHISRGSVKVPRFLEKEDAALKQHLQGARPWPLGVVPQETQASDTSRPPASKANINRTPATYVRGSRDREGKPRAPFHERSTGRPSGAQARGSRAKAGLRRPAGRPVRAAALEAEGAARAGAPGRGSRLPLRPPGGRRGCGRTDLGRPHSSSSREGQGCFKLPFSSTAVGVAHAPTSRPASALLKSTLLFEFGFVFFFLRKNSCKARREWRFWRNF